MEIGYKHTCILFIKHCLYINSNTYFKVLPEEEDHGGGDNICNIFTQALFLELASGLFVRNMARHIRALDGAALREGG
jgi:hypothetical protein